MVQADRRNAPRRATVAEWAAELARRFDEAHLFYGHGTHDARGEASWLLAHVLGVPFERLPDEADRVVGARHAGRIRRLAEERIRTRKPLAYLLHEAWLQGLRFYVDERVIVPRSFIAELLPAGLEPWTGDARRVRRVMDMCTGSGCLAILAAGRYPGASVTAVDVCAEALKVARRNVLRHRLDSRIELKRSDLFDGLAPEACDLILCNPPYVTDGSMKRLPPEYRHEPDVALAGGRDGLVLVDRILSDAPRFLSAEGVLVVEIGHNRRALERKYPRLPFTWLPTSAGDDMVFLLRRDELPETGASKSGRRKTVRNGRRSVGA